MKLGDILITALAIVVIGGFFVWFVVYTYKHEKYETEIQEKYKASLPAPGVLLDHKLVCMASDKYHGVDQTAVIVADKTYYGCNQKAIRDLNTNEEMRFAIDPYSKKSVDKALAFISIDPNRTGSILYFESEENLKNHFKR